MERRFGWCLHKDPVLYLNPSSPLLSLHVQNVLYIKFVINFQRRVHGVQEASLAIGRFDDSNSPRSSRLKTKCDRAVPCAPCIRRGCESICPSGLRARGSRFVFVMKHVKTRVHSTSRNPGAEVETLNRNIQSMTARIRQLEEALQMAHAHSSGSGSPTSPPGIYGSLVDQSAPEFNSIAARAHVSRLASPSQGHLFSNHLYFVQTDKNTEIALRQQILNMIPNENAARILLDQFYLTHGWVFVRFV